MLKLFIFILLELYALSTADDLVGITISKISRTINDDDVIQTTVTFDEITDQIGKIDHYHLQVIYNAGADQDQDESLGDKAATSAVFPRDIVTLAEGEVTFIITGQDANDKDTHWGKVKLTLPAFLEADPSIGAWVGDGSGDDSLRIFPVEKIHGYQLGDKACEEGTASKSCYYVGVPQDLENPLEFCQKVNEVTKAGKITVCDQTVIFADDKSGRSNPTDAELTYPKSGTGAQIIITGPPEQEIVVYKEDNTVVKVCYASPCNIGKHTPSTDTNKILVVEVSTNAATASTVLPITDYELVGTPLSSDLIETRWIRTKSKDTYKVSRTADGGDAAGAFTETSVTCADSDDTDGFHCFAYFVGLAAEVKYDLSVEKGTEDRLNKITLKDTQTLAAPGDTKMELSDLNTKWNKGLRSFEVNACVGRVDSTDLSSYEAILINNIGQWKKIQGLSQRSTNEFCFNEIYMDVHNFDLSSNLRLVVVKRANDGITVLQSVETVISV